MLTVCIFLGACKQRNRIKPYNKKACPKTASLQLMFAKGFSVDYYDGFKVITVRDSKDSTKQVAQYVLLPADKPAPVGFESATLITTPVLKTVCVSGTTIGEMAILNLLDSIAAVTNTNYIYNPVVLEKVREQQIADIGQQEINYERLVELHPSFVFTSGGYDGGDKLQLKLFSLKIASVLDLEYKEQSVLGRTEWIKFIASFYNREALADSLFNTIAHRYIQLKERAANTKTRPTVFCNLPFKEIWYMPCGDNYTTQLIQDAGGNFLWKDATASNGLNLSLDYEAVYNKAANADFWINTGSASSLKEISLADKKNTLFKAFKMGNVYNSDKRNTPEGGFDFWESAPVNPDKVLEDLIAIFHPELIPDRNLYYYKKLK